MTLLNEVRHEVISAFQGVHEAHYPDIKVNYPNLNIVDIEHQKDPFVTIVLDLSASQRAALGETELLVPGYLFVYYFFLKNTGTSGAYGYVDMLNTYIGMQQIGPITYDAVQPTSVESTPGWNEMMCAIRFDISSACE